MYDNFIDSQCHPIPKYCAKYAQVISSVDYVKMFINGREIPLQVKSTTNSPDGIYIVELDGITL